MGSKLRRGFSRLILHFLKFALVPVDVVSTRAYMKIWLGVLSRHGLVLDGTPRYIASNVKFDDMERTRLGDRVVVSKNVILLTHDYSITTALLAIGERPVTDVALRRDIVVGDNVFLGMNVVVLPGTTIESNVIVGAGSVVRGHVPGDSVVVGNPAVVIGSISDRRERWLEHSRSPYAFRDAR